MHPTVYDRLTRARIADRHGEARRAPRWPASPAATTGRDPVTAETAADRPLPRAGFEVIGLAADDAELWELVERSRSGADLAGASMPSWRSDGVSATAKASLHRPQEAGILVLSRRGHARYTLEKLTDRERDVLAALAEGRSNRAIARQLSITEHTVEKHIKNIFGALWLTPSPDDHRRVLAVLIYLAAVAPE